MIKKNNILDFKDNFFFLKSCHHALFSWSLHENILIMQKKKKKEKKRISYKKRGKGKKKNYKSTLKCTNYATFI